MRKEIIMDQSDRFSWYKYGEGRTGIGQMVNFTCPPDIVEQVREFLKTNIRTIDIPTTGRVNLPHGTYGRYTRYNIVQHDYAGGGPDEDGGWGYVEVLEIKNPPDDRWGIVIYECGSGNVGAFTEWETVEFARKAFKKLSGAHRTDDELSKFPGFKRRVACAGLTPWFYAIGDEQLIGDLAFPDGLQDDAVYRFGRKFVVFGYGEVPAVKTCMGTRFIKRKRNYHPYEEQQYRLVYWDDGSVWDESNSHGEPPRPTEEGEMWIAEAVQQFKRMLAGKSTEFVINFTDGHKFVGKLAKTKCRTSCAEGDYLLAIRFKGKKKTLRGWIRDFKPTKETPDVIQYVTQRYERQGAKVEYVEIEESQVKKGGKKWSGAFFRPSS